jgi:hypothetical protein
MILGRVRWQVTDDLGTEHSSIDLSPVRTVPGAKFNRNLSFALSQVLPLLCRISERLLRRIHAERLDGLETAANVSRTISVPDSAR